MSARSARSERGFNYSAITTRLAGRTDGRLVASITAVVPLFAPCFYVVAVILGDRFKYDDAMAKER